MVRPRITLPYVATQMKAGLAREAAARRAGRRATSGYYDRRTGRIMLELTNGNLFGFRADSIPELARTTDAQRAAFELSLGGDALHWEALDVDLSVGGLVLSNLGRTERVRELARLAGKVKSPAKAAAARKNGKKGGRPRRPRSA